MVPSWSQEEKKKRKIWWMCNTLCQSANRHDLFSDSVIVWCQRWLILWRMQKVLLKGPALCVDVQTNIIVTFFFFQINAEELWNRKSLCVFFSLPLLAGTVLSLFVTINLLCFVSFCALLWSPFLNNRQKKKRKSFHSMTRTDLKTKEKILLWNP